MKTLTTLTLTAALAATSVLADSHAMDEDADLIRSRDIVGGEIWTINGPMDEDTWGNWESTGPGPDWNDIGEIEDLVLNSQGQMIGVVAEVGGFLDIGDKHVFLKMEDVRLNALDDGQYVVVVRKTEEELEEMESVDEGFWD